MATIRTRSKAATGDQRLLRSLVTYLRKKDITEIKDIPADDKFLGEKPYQLILQAIETVKQGNYTPFELATQKRMHPEGESSLFGSAAGGGWLPLEHARWIYNRHCITVNGHALVIGNELELWYCQFSTKGAAWDRGTVCYGLQSLSTNEVHWFVITSISSAEKRIGEIIDEDVLKKLPPFLNTSGTFPAATREQIEILNAGKIWNRNAMPEGFRQLLPHEHHIHSKILDLITNASTYGVKLTY